MALFRTFMATSSSRSEVVGLVIHTLNTECGDLDLNLGVVKLRDGQGRERRCAIDPGTVSSLGSYLQARAIHPKHELPNLWLTSFGGLSVSGIHVIVADRAEKAGIRGFHLRRIRVTYAQHWLALGGNEGDLMRTLGLGSRRMIGRYSEIVAGSRSIKAARSFFDGARW